MVTAASGEEIAFDPPELRDALKRATSALKRDSVPFALAGSYALWVHGAPEPRHDVDIAVAEDEVEAAVDSLTAAGFEIERPPEDWLFKAHTDGAMVDVLHRIQGVSVDADLLERASELEVLGVRIPVLPATEIVTAKLLSLSEHYGDFGALLPVIRAVREQLDWDHLRTATEGRPFAEAFLFLTERLGIAPSPTDG